MTFFILVKIFPKLFVGVQLTKSQHWFRKRLGAEQPAAITTINDDQYMQCLNVSKFKSTSLKGVCFGRLLRKDHVSANEVYIVLVVVKWNWLSLPVIFPVYPFGMTLTLINHQWFRSCFVTRYTFLPCFSLFHVCYIYRLLACLSHQHRWWYCW